MSLALYRTYRPGRLTDVIGQEHVTAPLARALDSGRAHHAYLFTGPRGCGKTSTARILARSLNCAEGPTSDPCGVCVSCVDLAPNGPGSIDVIEMDAASHRGVEDARDLREKAMYAPALSTYRIYIIDEAHQLTNDAANALLKLIEEPPPHLKFVFATTEPDKILATIRSRTHHYPFRLVSGRRLQEHLAWVCEQEGVPADPLALALVAKAAAGSVRDSLSILGQLVAGSGVEGVTYADSVVQLGLTDSALLDEAISAVAASDGASLFSVVDRVVEAGLDPRRFAADILERLRDLIVLHQIPDAESEGLIDVPDEQLATMRQQVELLGLAQLSRAADLVNTGLSELKGATAPRLQLELLCARLLLPMSDDASVLARVEQLEQRAAVASVAPVAGSAHSAAAAPASAPPALPTPLSAPAAPAAPAAPSASSTPAPQSAPAGPPPRPARSAPADASVGVASAGGPPAPPKLSSIAPTTADITAAAVAAAGQSKQDGEVGQDGEVERDGGVEQSGQEAPGSGSRESTHASEPTSSSSPTPPHVGTTSNEVVVDLGAVVTMWPAVLEALKASSRVAHTLAEGSAPISRTSKGLVIAHPDKVRMDILRSNKGHVEHLRIAILDVVRLETDIDFTHNPDPSTPLAVSPAEPAAANAEPESNKSSDASPKKSARERIAEQVQDEVPVAEDVAAADDPDLDDSGLSGLALIQRELGGTVMTEYDND